MSKEKIKHWIKELRNYLENDLPIIAVANQYDLLQENQMNKAVQLEKFAKINDCYHFNTSAKTGQGIDLMFYLLAEKIWN